MNYQVLLEHAHTSVSYLRPMLVGEPDWDRSDWIASHRMLLVCDVSGGCNLRTIPRIAPTNRVRTVFFCVVGLHFLSTRKTITEKLPLLKKYARCSSRAPEASPELHFLISQIQWPPLILSRSNNGLSGHALFKFYSSVSELPSSRRKAVRSRPENL